MTTSPEVPIRVLLDEEWEEEDREDEMMAPEQILEVEAPRHVYQRRSGKAILVQWSCVAREFTESSDSIPAMQLTLLCDFKHAQQFKEAQLTLALDHGMRFLEVAPRVARAQEPQEERRTTEASINLGASGGPAQAGMQVGRTHERTHAHHVCTLHGFGHGSGTASFTWHEEARGEGITPSTALQLWVKAADVTATGIIPVTISLSAIPRSLTSMSCYIKDKRASLFAHP